MPHPTIYYGLLVLLAIGLLFAAATDLKRREIDNWLNAVIALAAPAFWWAGGLSLWPEVGVQLGLALGAFAIAAGLFTIGQMGGGDVKLITALALWFPPAAFIQLLIVMAILGYALTLGLGAWHVGRADRGLGGRDTVAVVALSAIAALLIATFAGWLAVPLPGFMASAAQTSIVAALFLLQLPVLLLALVSLQAIRSFRRPQVSMESPFGLAVAGGALWLVALQIASLGSLQHLAS